MHRNALNLTIAACALALTLGCFWSTDRESAAAPDESDNSETNVAVAPASNSENKVAAGKKPDKGDFIVELLEVKTPRNLGID